MDGRLGRVVGAEAAIWRGQTSFVASTEYGWKKHSPVESGTVPNPRIGSRWVAI